MDSESEGGDNVLWEETEAILATTAVLQEEALQRMNALEQRLCVTPSDPYHDMVTECHIASMEAMKQTGVVTFGQRLLMKLKEG